MCCYDDTSWCVRVCTCVFAFTCGGTHLAHMWANTRAHRKAGRSAHIGNKNTNTSRSFLKHTKARLHKSSQRTTHERDQNTKSGWTCFQLPCPRGRLQAEKFITNHLHVKKGKTNPTMTKPFPKPLKGLYVSSQLGINLLEEHNDAWMRFNTSRLKMPILLRDHHCSIDSSLYPSNFVKELLWLSVHAKRLHTV